MIVLLMGVSGSGKTAVGERLASRLDCEFVDGDDLHPEINVAKMSAGIPLMDEDRWPWLKRIRNRIDVCETSGSSVIIACSALKERYRKLLLEGTSTTRLVYLRGERSLIERRLADRQGHFFGPQLLSSQFAALEEPEQAVVVDIDTDIESVAAAVLSALGIESADDSEDGGE